MCRSGITHEEMVQESKRHWQRLEQNAQKHQKVSKDEHTSQVSGLGYLLTRLQVSLQHLCCSLDVLYMMMVHCRLRKDSS